MKDLTVVREINILSRQDKTRQDKTRQDKTSLIASSCVFSGAIQKLNTPTMLETVGIAGLFALRNPAVFVR
ncbi:MAG: hypothetical protein K6E84_06700 [Lachnospiraceae bacterium]|nr:hypothetical protein [Lachnospiraceae bacterium]